MDLVYPPHEDSFLMLEKVSEFLKKIEHKVSILEIGSGSGYIAIELAKKFKNKIKKITAVDINENAIKEIKQRATQEQIDFIEVTQSDLFENIKGQYDVIIFNPPYLPQDKLESEESIDSALYGGKKGYEITHRFIKQINNHLGIEGNCFLLLCNLSKPNTSLELLEKYDFEYNLVGGKKCFPEELFIYQIKFSQLIKRLKFAEVNNVELFAKGKKGKVFTGKLNNQLVKIKVLHDSTDTVRLKNEVDMIKRLEEYDFVPKLISFETDYFIQEFIEGINIDQWINEVKEKKEFKSIIKKNLEICKILDEHQIDKKEMNHPHKHILIDSKKNVFYIDFERSSLTPHPKNVTQFVNYLTASHNKEIFEKFDMNLNVQKINQICKEYKEKYEDKYFEQLIDSILI